MALLRSLDGKFYEVPEADLAKFEVPPEKVQEMGGAPEEAPPAGPGYVAAPVGGYVINVNINLPPFGAPAAVATLGGDVEGHQSVQGAYGALREAVRAIVPPSPHRNVTVAGVRG